MKYHKRFYHMWFNSYHTRFYRMRYKFCHLATLTERRGVMTYKGHRRTAGGGVAFFVSGKFEMDESSRKLRCEAARG